MEIWTAEAGWPVRLMEADVMLIIHACSAFVVGLTGSDGEF